MKKSAHIMPNNLPYLKQAGTPIGGNDLWIASHALAEQAVLVTNNVREFERIQHLRIANWVT